MSTLKILVRHFCTQKKFFLTSSLERKYEKKKAEPPELKKVSIFGPRSWVEGISFDNQPGGEGEVSDGKVGRSQS